MLESENNKQISKNKGIIMKENKSYENSVTDEIMSNLDEAKDLIEQAETDKLFGDNYARMLFEDFNNMRDSGEITLKAKILIVDDDEGIRRILETMVGKLGHTTMLAENGISALEQMEADPPDLVLLDINMPEMDGNVILNCMKANEKLCLIPVIMATGVDTEESMVQNIENGADAYLTKPFNFKLLTARVKSCLEKKQLMDWKRDMLL